MAQDKKNEGAQYVVDGAIYKCQYGSAPCQMQVLTNQRIFAQNKPIATDQEVVFKVPTASFVNCIQNPNKQAPVCTYANGKWDPNTTVQQGKLNALTEDSTMKCPMFAGDVSCVFPGQVQGVSAGDFNVEIEKLSNFPLVYVMTFPDKNNDAMKKMPAIYGVSAMIRDFKLQAPIYVRSNETITLRAYIDKSGKNKTELGATDFVNWAISTKKIESVKNPQKGKKQPPFVDKTFLDKLVLYKIVCSPFNIRIDEPGIYYIEGGSNSMVNYYTKQFKRESPLDNNNKIPKYESCSLKVEVLEHNRILDVNMDGDYIKGEGEEKDVYIIKNSSKILIHVRTALALNEDEELQLLINGQRQSKCKFLIENSPLITLLEARPVAHFCLLKSGFFNNAIEKRVQVVLSSLKTGVIIEQKIFRYKVIDGYVSASVTLEGNKPVPENIRPGTSVYLSVYPADEKGSIPDLKNAVWLIKGNDRIYILSGISNEFKLTREGKVTIELDLSKCNSVIKKKSKGVAKTSYSFNVARNVITGVNSATPTSFYPGIPYSIKFDFLYEYNKVVDGTYHCSLSTDYYEEREIDSYGNITNIVFDKCHIGKQSLLYYNSGVQEYKFNVKPAEIEKWKFADKYGKKINTVGFEEKFYLNINIPVWGDYQKNIKKDDNGIGKVRLFLLNNSSTEIKPIAIKSLEDAKFKNDGTVQLGLEISKQELVDHYITQYKTSKLPEKIILTASLVNPPYLPVEFLSEKSDLKGHWSSTRKDTSSLILTTVPEVSGFFSGKSGNPQKSVMKYGDSIYIILFTHNYKDKKDKLLVELIENNQVGSEDKIVKNFKDLEFDESGKVKIDISDQFKDENAHGDNPNPRLFYFRVKLDGNVVYQYPQTQEDVFNMKFKNRCESAAANDSQDVSSEADEQQPVQNNEQNTEAPQRPEINDDRNMNIPPHQQGRNGDRNTEEPRRAMLNNERREEVHQRPMHDASQNTDAPQQTATPNASQSVPSTDASQQTEPECDDSDTAVITQDDDVYTISKGDTSCDDNLKSKIRSYLWQLKVGKDKEVKRLNPTLAIVAPVVVGEELKKGEKMETNTRCFCHRDFTVEEMKNFIAALRGGKVNDMIWESSPDVDDKSISSFTRELNVAFKRYGINKCIQKITFLAQAVCETGCFKMSEEGVSDSEYGGYKGRGLMQLTHRDTYEKYNQRVAGVNIVEQKRYIGTHLHYIVDSGATYFTNTSFKHDYKWDKNSKTKFLKERAEKFKESVSVKRILSLNDLCLFMEKYDEETYFFLISKLLNGYDKGQVNEAPNGWSTRKEAFNTLKNTFKYDKKVCKEVEEDFPVNNTGWHDPLDVMQICAYSFHGHRKPYFASFHYRPGRAHQGVDLFAKINTPIYACLDGRIAFAGIQGDYGKMIILAISEESQVQIFKNRRKENFTPYYSVEYTDGPGFNKDSSFFYLAYAHLSSFNVLEGDFVKSGDVIGFSGETGNAKGTKGPHVHFEVRDLKFAGKSTNHRCNPALYFDYEQYTPISKDNERVESEKSFGAYDAKVKKIEIRHVDGSISEMEKKDFESDDNEQYCYKKNKV